MMSDEQREKLKKLIVELVKDPVFHPMKAKEMEVLMGVPKQEKASFESLLQELVGEGEISLNARGRYARPGTFRHEGVFHSNARGFGFVTVEGRERDIFIPGSDTNHALEGDTVLVTIEREEGRTDRTEGRVVGFVKHAHDTVVGMYRKNHQGGLVIPDDPKLCHSIRIPAGRDLHAVSGHKVNVHITDYGSRTGHLQGEIVEILGHVNDPGVDVLSIIKAYGLPETFPEDVERAAAELPDTIPEEEIEKRKAHDFRGLPTVTIDGEDARDLDDAVSLERIPDGFRLYVHIADVSFYVREHSLLDEEALNRSTSVYLTDRVLPMLPRALSNGICSLNEGEDRLTMSCVMDIDRKGNIISHEICESVIRSDKRMSYTGVHSLLTGEPLENGEDPSSYEPFREMLTDMLSLSEILRKRRRARGSIDFDIPESMISLAEDGTVLSIGPRVRNESHKLIEDFMLAANETVAEDYYWQEIPFLYRVHEKPDPEKFRALVTTVGTFGHFLRMKDEDSILPKEVQKLLDSVEGTDEEAVIKTMTLRAMKQARYSTTCSGHFGLAAKYYTHFTSPIRRYPDLQIHRIIRENLEGDYDERRLMHYRNLLPMVADRTSTLERRANEAERETDKLKMCEYLSHHRGETFDGHVSGLTKYGMYVELPNTIEGMVPLRLLDGDTFTFHEEKYALIGERTGRSFHLGDSVRVIVMNVDRLTRTIDFVLASSEEN